MIITQAPNEELIKDVNEHREMLFKQAEEALDANKEAAEEIEKYHGEDTKKPISNKQLKAMQLSEALFEDLDEEDYFDFEHEIYDAIRQVCLKPYNMYLSIGQIKRAVENFLDRIEDDEEFTDFFNQSQDEVETLPGVENESLMEDLSQTGQKLLNELKKELGPDLQKKVAYVIKDYARNQLQDTKKQKQDTENDLTEAVDISRYSDVIPYENRKYWYFTTHGVGPGTIPSDLHVLEVKEGQNDKGTSGHFVLLDGVLNTSELEKYDMKEMVPPSSLTENYTDDVQTLKIMHAVMQSMNNENAYMSWIYVMPDEPSEDDFEWLAENDFKETEDFFNRVYKRFHKDGLYQPSEAEIEFCKRKDAELNLPEIEVIN